MALLATRGRGVCRCVAGGQSATSLLVLATGLHGPEIFCCLLRVRCLLLVCGLLAVYSPSAGHRHPTSGMSLPSKALHMALPPHGRPRATCACATPNSQSQSPAPSQPFPEPPLPDPALHPCPPWSSLVNLKPLPPRGAPPRSPGSPSEAPAQPWSPQLGT